MSFIAPIPYLVSAKPRTFRPKRVTAARTARHRRRGGSFDAPSRLGRVTPALDQSARARRLIADPSARGVRYSRRGLSQARVCWWKATRQTLAFLTYCVWPLSGLITPLTGTPFSERSSHDANPIWPSGAVERFRCGTDWNIQAYGSSLCDLGISEVSMGTTLFRASHHLLRNASTIAAEKAVE